MLQIFKHISTMKVTVVVLFVLIASISVQSADHYHIDGNNYYVSTPDQANWYQAMKFCLYNGMFLIDVGTYFENARILSIIEMTKAKYNLTLADYWTSGTDLGTERQFYWATTGHSILWEYWGDGEPSNAGENCVHYYQGKAGKWNDMPCNIKLFFICRDKVDVPVYKKKDCCFRGNEL